VFQIPGLAPGTAGTVLASRTYTGNPEAGLTETTMIEVHHEGPVVVEHTARWIRYFLQGINYPNRHEANVDWNEAGGMRSLKFRLNGQVYDAPVSGAAEVTTENFSFDVGSQYQLGTMTIEARAIREGECSPWKVLKPPAQHQSRVPPWAAPASLTAADGILYSGTLNWPADLTHQQPIVQVPVIDGQWGFAGGEPKTEVRAHSTGTPTQGTVSGNVRVGLGPVAFHQFAVSGTTTGTLTTELDLQGNLTANLGRVSATRQVGVLTLVPEAAAACSFPLISEVCAALNGWAGVTAEAYGDARLQGDFSDQGDSLKFTAGSARVGIGASAFIAVALPPPLDVAGFRVGGGGNGCVEFDVAPSFAYKRHGGQLEFRASAFWRSRFHGACESAERAEGRANAVYGVPQSGSQSTLSTFTSFTAFLTQSSSRTPLTSIE
jgi:hypothetical protein